MPSPGLNEMTTTTQRNRGKPLQVQKVKVKMTMEPGKGGASPARAAQHVQRVIRTATGYKRNPSRAT